MKHMLQIEVRGLSKVDAETARDYLRGQVLAQATWGEKAFSAERDEEGVIVLSASMRFDDLSGKADILTKMKNWLGNHPESSGYIEYHQCRHDENPPTPCKNIVKEWGNG